MPVRWTLNAKRYASFSDILENSTVLAAIPDMSYAGGNSLSHIVQYDLLTNDLYDTYSEL